MPEAAGLFFKLNLGIGYSGLAVGTPVYDSVTAIDKSLIIQVNEYLSYCLAASFIHGEAFALPVAGCAELAELLCNASAVLVLPIPCFLEETFTADILLFLAFGSKLLNDLDLGRDGCVVGAGQPERFIAAHSLVADEYILQCLIKRMPDMKLPRDIGWGNDDAVWFFVGVGLGMKISLCLPVCIDPILNGGWIIGLGHFVNALCAFFTHLF